MRTRFWRSCAFWRAVLLLHVPQIQSVIQISLHGLNFSVLVLSVLSECKMAPKQEFRRAPDAAHVDGKRSYVNLARHFLTHGIRLAVAKDLSFTKQEG